MEKLNIMKEIFIFTIITYSTCNILIYGSIFEGWRKFLKGFGSGPKSLHKLFTCMMCLPVWVGFLLSTLFIITGNGDLTPLGELNLNIYLQIFLDGILASGLVWLIHTVQEYFEK